jgi:hypothetical protein
VDQTRADVAIYCGVRQPVRAATHVAIRRAIVRYAGVVVAAPGPARNARARLAGVTRPIRGLSKPLEGILADPVVPRRLTSLRRPGVADAHAVLAEPTCRTRACRSGRPAACPSPSRV